MVYLIIPGILGLLFGLILLISPNSLNGVSVFFDKVLFTFEEKLYPYKRWIGIFWIIAAAWLFYLSIRYPELSLLHPLWILALFFAILYLFLPNWLAWLSNVLNRNVLPTDRYVRGFCKVVGILFLIVSVYILYVAYLVR